ncbi:MAG: 16S rRNA (cytidine(1402)-2'-O)-methyltransferase [Coriobacteriia bacterium]|nr:16S rRNA (cytidine(1402)-2'-O)-methyltransferase [Coriobacteriia bacterium]
MAGRTSSDAEQAVRAPGRLLVCATPIGNLGDVTSRVLDALRDADVIEAEDTRVTRKLLTRFSISTPLESYHAKNLERRTPEVVARVRAGASVALVSDAGTPGISDPGARLVDACLEEGLPVDVLPGPSAIVTALVASGLPTHAFYFGGFLPRKAGDRRRALEKLAALDATLVFYEAPARTAATVASLAEAFPGRRAAMARELTKLYEEVARAPVEELARALAGRELKGEVVLLVGPPDGRAAEIDEGAVAARIAELVADGVTRKDAVKQAARELGVPRNVAYGISVRD